MCVCAYWLSSLISPSSSPSNIYKCVKVPINQFDIQESKNLEIGMANVEDIVIVGGGIAGLATSLGLHRYMQ